MPDDIALAIDGNALAHDGYAIVGGSSCPCCGDCPLWRKLVRCDSGGYCGDGPPPPPTEVWACSTVTCQNGPPLAPNMVVVIDGFCFRVTSETSTNPPGARLGPDPLQCVDGCDDPVCPQGELYWPGRFCSGDSRTVWICGVPPGCHIRGCIVVDGSATPIRFDQIPDNPPLLARFIDLGPSASNCCDCLTNDPNDPPGEGPCITTPLLSFTPGPPCHAFIGQQSCCCELDFSTGQGVPRTQFRLTRMKTEQTYIRPGLPDLEGTTTIDLLDACSLQFQLTRIGYGLPPEGERETGDPWPLLPSAAGCGPRCPGSWPAFAQRVLGINGSQRLTGLPGITWGNDCQSYTNDDGTTTEVVSFTQVYTCNLFRQIAVYRYSDPQNGITIVTRFEYEGQIIGENRCLANCRSIIGGGVPVDDAGQPIDAPPQGGAGGGVAEGVDGIAGSTGCSGCGQGQRRTRV